MTRRATLPMRSGRWILAIACASVTMVASFAPPGHAQGVDAGAVDSQMVSPPEEAQRWWGAAGAMLCATEIRLMRVVPAIGFNPYAIAAGVGGCVLAAMDLLSTE